MSRYFILVLTLLTLSCNGNAQRDQNQREYPVSKSEAEWKAELSDEEYYVLREKGTEPAFSSPLNDIRQPGTFVCAACGQALYKTTHKFDSGTGWPSFDRAFAPDNVAYRPDRIGGISATEVVCGNCGGHLGHVFDDGPEETTGKRHCINGVAMDFIPDNE